MRGAAFLDSGIFIALMNRRDRWHLQAVTLFSNKKQNWATSYWVISEAYSWFLHRYGEESARAFRQFLDNLTGLEVFEATASHHALVCKTLDRYRGSKLTYVDASSLALLDAHRIKTVWSTDHHLGISGAEVLPRT